MKIIAVSLVAHKLSMADRGQSSVEPRSEVLMSRRGEGGTTDLFCVQVVFNFLEKKRIHSMTRSGFDRKSNFFRPEDCSDLEEENWEIFYLRKQIHFQNLIDIHIRT